MGKIKYVGTKGFQVTICNECLWSKKRKKVRLVLTWKPTVPCPKKTRQSNGNKVTDFFVSLVYRQVNKETKLDARSSVSNNWIALNSNSNLTLLSCNYTMGNKRQTSNRPKIIQKSTAIPLHFFFYFTPLPPPLSSSVCLQVTMD